MDCSCDRIACDSGKPNGCKDLETNQASTMHESHSDTSLPRGEQYWKSKYEQLQRDFDHLQGVNQNLEEKLLNVVETFERKREELMANVEYEKSTLMADVNKLSNKLVDARIKLHDFEEKEILHAAECSAPCHKASVSSSSSSLFLNPSATSTQTAPPRLPPAPRASPAANTNGFSTAPLKRPLAAGADSKIDPKQMEQMANDPNLI